jgi:4-carboxymuconolactone decarboxylase
MCEARVSRGEAVYARIFHVSPDQAQAAMASRVGPTFAREAMLAAGGPAWAPSGLTDRERSIAVITALTAQGVSGDRLSAHLALAHEHGLDTEALTALMLLLASYLGYAKASLAMEAVAAEVPARRRQLP